MSSPTKADLAAAVTKLSEENAALRELLGAVQALAAVPAPAAYSDRYYWDCADRLSTVAVWAELDENATGPYAVPVIRGWAKAVRKYAAEPVRYELHAEPEADLSSLERCVTCDAPSRLCEHNDGTPRNAGPEPATLVASTRPEPANPPYHMTPGTIGPCCLAEDSGYICNAQENHDGPDHVAYDSDNHECHRWPVAPAPVASGTPVAAGDDTPAGSGTPDWCPATTVYDEGDDHLPLYCDRPAGHEGSHHAPGPDEGSEVAWSDEAAASVTL